MSEVSHVMINAAYSQVHMDRLVVIATVLCCQYLANALPEKILTIIPCGIPSPSPVAVVSYFGIHISWQSA